LRHPYDGKAWKHFDNVCPDFVADPWHIRLSLYFDSFTPYVQASTSLYFCWFVFVTPYDLPPDLCMTKPFLFLTCLILGPINLTKKG